jgi:hypothetical protein
MATPIRGGVESTPAARLEAIIGFSDEALAAGAPILAEELLAIGEAALTNWLTAKGATPTEAKVEGFRLLALHRQGARGDPSFNACRETCRELAYHYNCIRRAADIEDTARRIRLGAMVVRHLVLFIDGKLEIAGLGEFCCSSRPLRLHEAGAAARNP